LVSIAEVAALNLNLSLDREAKCKKKNLIKWLDDNLDQIRPFLHRVLLFDIDGQPIQNVAVSKHDEAHLNGGK
jgi:hypothetical protein